MKRLGILLLTSLLLSCSGPQDKPSVTLYLALQRGDLNQIERHIKWGTDINQTLPSGMPPLHMAAADGRLAISRLLIKKGAQTGAKDSEGRTPMFRALQNGRTQIAGLLLKMGAALDANNMLLQLIQQQELDRDGLGFLLEQGADINTQMGGMTPLNAAITVNNLDLVKLLIRGGADVNLPDATGLRPIQLATKGNNPDIIRHLSRQGASAPQASPNSTTGENKH